MKHPRKSFVSLVLAVAMVIICILSFGGVDAAALAQYSFYDTVYYFYDLYPTAKEEDLQVYFNANSLVLDRQNVTEQEFYTRIQDGYFETVQPESLVFIDIKNFKPDQLELSNLLSSLKGRDCDIVLVATYSQSEFSNSSLGQYVDLYFEASYEQLEMFVKMSVDDLFFTFEDNIAGTCILIDGNMVDILNYGSSFSTLCTVSPFLRLLLVELATKLELECYLESSTNITSSTYRDIVDSLYDDYNISLLVHRSGSTYRDLSTSQIIRPSVFSDLSTLVAPSGTRYCAFGFWTLPSNFHDFLYAGQQLLGYNNLPVYVFEIEAVINSTSGLVVCTDVDMEPCYRDIFEDLYGIVYDERERFLAELEEMEERLQ